MQTVLKTETIHILRFDKNDDVISLLQSYCKEKQIPSAVFTGLGACKSVTIAYYDLENKKYLDRTEDGDYEIIGITGNISQMDGEYLVHSHGSFSGPDYHVFGGHIKKLVVSATCEVHLTVLKYKMERKFHKETGLNLLQ